MVGRKLKFPVNDLAEFINRNCVITKGSLENMNIKNSIITQAALNLFSSESNACRFAVLQALKRNTGNIRSKLIYHEYSFSKSVGQTSEYNKIDCILRYLKSKPLTSNDFRKQSYRNVESIYGELCKSLKEKNNVKNRKKICVFLKRHIDEIELVCNSPVADVFNCSMSPIPQVDRNSDNCENAMLHSTINGDSKENDRCSRRKQDNDVISSNRDRVSSDDDDNDVISSDRDRVSSDDYTTGIDSKETSFMSPIPRVIENSDSCENTIFHSTIIGDLKDTDDSTCSRQDNNAVSSESGRNESKDILIINVTPDSDHDIANQFLYLNNNENSFLLPSGSINMRNTKWAMPSYKLCKIKEGEFTLSKKEFDFICRGERLIENRYQFIINKKIKSTKTPRLRYCLNSLLKICCGEECISGEKSISNSSPSYPDEATSRSLYKNSPFFIHFQKKISEQCFLGNNVEGKFPDNLYYNPDFFNIVMRKYIPYVSLWSGLLLNGLKRKSNAPVERWYGILKNNILNNCMRQKCSRVVRKIRKYTLFVYNEEKLGISNKNEKKVHKQKLSMNPQHSEENDRGLASQENWSKRDKMTFSYFQGNVLRKALDKSRVVDDTIHPCLYCGLGFLDETAMWYGCEKCNGWVHQICEENFMPVTDDEPYFCKFCLSSASKTGNDEENEAIKARPSNMACYDYVAAQYRKSTEELEALEVKTRGQSKCDLWFSERRTRITASLFGRVFKGNKPETMKKIALDITNPPQFKSAATEYGKATEKYALKSYEIEKGVQCSPSGLHIHRDHQYIAASPDGLVGNNGVIEIKCPYKMKDVHPDEACEKGLLPYCNKQTDPDYYKDIHRGYIIATFPNIPNIIREITQEDFRILSGREWLTNFFIDIYLNIINEAKGKNYQVVPCLMATRIFLFASKEYHPDIDDFEINKDLITFPVLQNFSDANPNPGAHHFCLCLVDFRSKCLSFLNPLGSTAWETKSYMLKFLEYIKYYNKNNMSNRVSTENWNIKVLEHDKQKDSYNCGPFILYFFEKIVEGQMLTNNVDINEFRKSMRKTILQMSDNMTNKCLYCGVFITSVLPSDIVECANCGRIHHKKCIVQIQTDAPMLLCQLCDGF
ncbi:hypothetical protein JTB14_029889 [Gonioctena quinquepunctata]|nr:hypothetical protein JTB14_029889 [Gonioctena quinquepunctata]